MKIPSELLVTAWDGAIGVIVSAAWAAKNNDGKKDRIRLTERGTVYYFTKYEVETVQAFVNAINGD